MAFDEPIDPERPPDEAWWARELHRNEKLMDKYMAVLGDNPDWEKVHNEFAHDSLDGSLEMAHTDEDTDEPNALAEENEFDGSCEVPGGEPGAEGDSEDDPEVNVGYQVISQMAREFACNVFNLDDPPCNAELLFLSAGKVGANLAGGHGIGYDDEFICGNIVKCRWALSDCEFCREMLEHLYERTGNETYARLADDSRRFAEAIRERIAALRRRVWW